MKSLNALDFPDVENNIYYQRNKENFLTLKHIVESNPKNYHHQIVRSRCNKWLFDWINAQVPLLADPFFNIGTKVSWILRGLTSFPECVECGFVFDERNVSVRSGYPDFCSSKCSNSSPITKKKQCDTKIDKYGNPYYSNTQKSRQTRYLRNDGKWESQETKNKRKQTNIDRFGVECNFQSEDTKSKSRATNLKNLGVEYPTQSPKVFAKVQATKIEKYGNKVGDPEKLKTNFTPEIRAKAEATCLRKYGVKNGGASKQAQEKAKKRYFFDETSFDSSDELALYIWLKDHNKEFIYHDGTWFEYMFDGESHRYYPDFFIIETQTWIEIKGDHFFEDKDSKKRMVCPYRTKSMTNDEYARKCDLFEAKHQCMVENGVCIILSSECKCFRKYVEYTYGKNYIQNFRKKMMTGEQ